MTPPKTDKEIMAKYIPESSLEMVMEIMKKYQIVLNIKAARRTKLGDFRAPHQNLSARISMNADLNPYAFLITLVHEIAHWLVWEKHGPSKKIKPHGQEWKNNYQKLMDPFLICSIFPEKILILLTNHMKNPKASTVSDIPLALALKKHDNKNEVLHLGDLQTDDAFIFRGSSFKIIKKNRSRFLCQEKQSGKQYLIHSIAEIERIDS